MPPTALQKHRSLILACGTAALAAVGAWTGATFKTDEQRQTVVIQSPSERLEEMERLRMRLTQRSSELEAKINMLEERARSKSKPTPSASP